MMQNIAHTLLINAQNEGYAIGAFNVYDSTGVQAVIAAAEKVHSPALIQLHPQALSHGGQPLVALALRATQQARVPIAVHLDHCSDTTIIAESLDIGILSIMADGSHLDYDANLAFVASATGKAQEHGAIVEGELGRISGTEDGLTVEAVHARMTNPAQAAHFVAETGIHSLAVCVGNVHGKYPFPPQLDFPRLANIRDAISVPLVMHGASGLPQDQIQQSIALGICKFNVNTEVRMAYLDVLRTAQLNHPQIDLVPLLEKARDAMRDVIIEKMHLFGSVNRVK
ncbi:MAG: class II fructose-bisphosphate aldolase [Chloroflexota bacterium]